MTDEIDILVIGSGAAGLSAAVAARQNGAETVMVLESEQVVGGSSRLASGVVMASGSKLQASAGIADDPATFFHDYLAWNNLNVEIGPVHTLTQRSGDAVDWLHSLGVPFYEELIRCLIEPAYRGHCVHGGGQGLIDSLVAECRRLEVDIALNQRVDRLLTEGTRVIGAAVGPDELHAKTVIIASGGFGASTEKIQQFFPDVYVEGLSWYVGADGARGDALEFGAEVGAQMAGMHTGLRTVTPDFSPLRVLEAHLPGWAILVDSTGKRFIDESLPYGVLDTRLRAVGDRAFVVFDDAALRPPEGQAADYRDAYRAKWPHRDAFKPINWVAETIDQMVASGRVQRADTLTGLAESLDLPVATFTAEITRYNQMVRDGHDFDKLKPASFLKEAARAPFYGVALHPAVISETAYGLRIDELTRVLHESGTVLEGLYAAGECTGGVLGPAYLGSGGSLMNSTTMGMVAGESAAAYCRGRGVART